MPTKKSKSSLTTKVKAKSASVKRSVSGSTGVSGTNKKRIGSKLSKSLIAKTKKSTTKSTKEVKTATKSTKKSGVGVKGASKLKRSVKSSPKSVAKDTKVKGKLTGREKSMKPVSKAFDDDLLNNDDDLFGSLDAPTDSANIYDELISKKLEKEIVKSQRKLTAGKDQKSKDSKRHEFQKNVPVRDRVIELSEVISVKEFSEKTGIGAAKVIGELMKNGILANINQQIDFDTASIIAGELGVNVKKRITAASAEDVFTGNLENLLKDEDASDKKHRPPIIVVMGHVDHGKTSLLDAIRETNVVKGESGGITQHIGAYQVEKNGKKITFLDTPGHEAFTSMRARGAKVTDIAILVVAADEGVKPQTIEAIQHAKEAGVPIIVAINKIDKEGADPDRVKGELGEYELIPEEWGGSTIMCPVSAHTGQGIPHLLEMILLVADLENLKANPDRSAIGTVIEAHLDKNLGPIATVIVNTGTLKLMDNIVVGGTYGRIKLMKDYNGKNIRTAGPSFPVLIAGLNSPPQSGDIFQVVSDEKTARVQSQSVQTLKEAALLSKRGVGEIISQIGSGSLNQLKLVLKADTKGSLEAIRQSLAEIKNEDVAVKVILSGVGNITESDVMMAAAAGGVVMGFHTGLHSNVNTIAERENVEIMQYTVIYKLLDDVTKILNGLLEPEMVETVVGSALVKQIFMTKKKEMIIGCKVLKGKIEKVKVRVYRKEELIGEGRINTLRKVDQQVNEVGEGGECGILYSGFMPLQEDDVLEAYKIEKRIRTL